ncbi:TetR/AcrR family transcriptional regulator [Nocardia sp. NPDC055053]
MIAGARRYGGLPVNVRRAERRRQFLDAATRVCAERGHLACSLAEICASAGLSKRQFYEEFETRDDLLVAVYTRIQDDAAAAVARALADLAVPTDPVAALRAGLSAYLLSIGSEPYRAKIALLEVTGAGEHTEQRCRAHAHNWAAHIQSSLATTGIRLGGDTAPLLAATVNAIAREWMLRETNPPLSDLIGLLTDLALLLVTREASPDCGAADS